MYNNYDYGDDDDWVVHPSARHCAKHFIYGIF